MFKLRQKWNIGKDVVLPLKVEQEKEKEKLILALTYIGENFVRDARIKGNYKDHTGNLRSSIGYGVYNNGKQVKLSVTASENDNNGDGVKTAVKVIEKNVLKKGIVLIVVAGMEYAYAVESKGYDVLTAFAPEKNSVLATLKSIL